MLSRLARLVRAYNTRAGRHAVRNLVGLFACTGLSQLALFGIVVLAASHLGPVGFGSFIFAVTLQNQLCLIGTAGAQPVVVREAAAHPESMDDITSSFFTVTGATSSLIAVCVIGAALVLPLPLSAEEQGLILLFSVANVAASINLSPLFDAQHQQVKGALGTTVGDVLSFTVAALLAQAGLLTLWAIGVILTCKWVAGTLLQALLYHFTVRRIRFRASAHGALQMARSSFPILGSYFLCTVPLSFGVFFLRFFRGPEATGIFGLACQVGLLTFVFAWLGIRIIQPHVGGEFGLHRSFVRKLILFLALFLAGLGAAAFLGGTLVIRVGFDPAFRAAIPAMGVLIAASAILSAGVAASLYLLLFHQERRVLFVYACSAAVYLCGSALVIPEYGIGGAAAVTLASAAIGTVMMLVLASRLAGRVR